MTSKKLLGFIVSNLQIEVDLDKIKVIQNLLMPRTEKKVRGFLGWLNYISRFISHLTNKCDPTFKFLKKQDFGEWDEDCQKAFDKVKEYLFYPPILVPPVLGRMLILYLAIHEKSMGCVLGQYDETVICVKYNKLILTSKRDLICSIIEAKVESREDCLANCNLFYFSYLI